MPERRGRKIHYMPIFRFVPTSGVPIEVQSHLGSAMAKRLSIGSVVPVLYDPTDPQCAEIAGFTRLWGAPSILIVMSAALVIGSIKASG